MAGPDEKIQENEAGQGDTGLDAEQQAQIDDLESFDIDFSLPDSQESETEQEDRQATPKIDPVQLWTGLVDQTSKIAAHRWGAVWAFQPEESEMLGGSVAAALDYYLPDQEPGPGMALVMALGMTVGPRVFAMLSEGVPNGDTGKTQPSE